MAGLIGEDYSGIAGLGGAVEGFAKGMMQAEEMIDRREERKFKRMEWEAQQKAKEIDRERRDAWEKEERDYRERKLELDRQQNEERMAMMRMMAGAKPTVGQSAVDTTFAKDYADYQAGGGKATVEKNIGLLEGAIQELEKPGELGGKYSSALGDTGQDYLSPESSQVRDKIRSAIQASLKQVMGGQFTEKEAIAMFNRAYNPRLSDAENIARTQATLQEIRNMADEKDAAARHFEQYGSLKGYKPRQRLAAEPQGLLGQSPGLIKDQPKAGKIAVTNGKETLLIDPADLKDAEKDGYRRAGK